MNDPARPTERRLARVRARLAAGARRTGRIGRRVLLLAVLAAVVLGMGTSVSVPVDSPSVLRSDAARADARLGAERLARFADSLSISAGRLTVGEQLKETAAQMRRQADLLRAADGSGPFDDPSGGQAPGNTPTTAVPPTSTADLIDRLAVSATTNLAQVPHVDPGMARLLAAVAAGQWLQVLALANAAEIPEADRPPAPEIVARGAGTDAIGTEGTDTDGTGGSVSGMGVFSAGSRPAGRALNLTTAQDPTDAVTGQDGVAGGTRCVTSGGARSLAAGAEGTARERASLEAVLAAERSLIYAGEVTAARTGTAAPASVAGILQLHVAAADEAERLLAARCATPAPPAPGYVLPPVFEADPVAGLASLETYLAPLYADLVGLSTGEVRSWAAGRLLETARVGWELDGTLPATPGLPPITVDGAACPDCG